MIKTIRPMSGFDNIKFKMKVEEISSLLNDDIPNEIDYKDGRKLYNFKEANLMLLFKDNYGLISITINNCDYFSEIELWEKIIFNISQKELIKLINIKGINFKKEVEQFEDSTIYIPTEGLIFYFNEENLGAIEIYDCNTLKK